MAHDCIVDGWNHGDELSLEEIARAWSKVAGDKPELLVEALVNTGFWPGEFERNGQSALFILLPPDSSSSERRPGNYATQGEVVVKVAEDLHSYVTADRKRSPILRENVAYVLWRPSGWRAIVPGYPADFVEWPDDKRDLAYPDWRAKHGDVYRVHSTIPMEKWPTSPVDMRYHCSLWRIQRDDFARWYRNSSLSAGAPLEHFWPSGESSDSEQALHRTLGAPPSRPAIIITQVLESAVLKRKWLTLPAGLIWAMTRNPPITEKVQKDPKSFNGISLNTAFQLAEEKAYGLATPTYFPDAKSAWLAIRDLIADEKIRAEGQLIERPPLRDAAVETTYANSPIPSGEAGNLIMLDNWAGFTDTVLGPDETYRFHYGQGRYWKRVRISAHGLLVAFPVQEHGLSSEPQLAVSETPVPSGHRDHCQSCDGVSRPEPPLPRAMQNILRAIVQASKKKRSISWFDAAPKVRDPIVHTELFHLGIKSEERPANPLSFGRVMRNFVKSHWVTVRPYVESKIADIPD